MGKLRPTQPVSKEATVKSRISGLSLALTAALCSVFEPFYPNDIHFQEKNVNASWECKVPSIWLLLVCTKQGKDGLLLKTDATDHCRWWFCLENNSIKDVSG